MSQIDFEKDLGSYLRKTLPKISVNAAATQEISKLLNLANARLLREMASAKKKSVLHASQFAADKILPKYMLRLAKSEAMRQLALYEIGLLDYAGSTSARMEGRRISKTKRTEKAAGKGGKKTTGAKKGTKTSTGLSIKRKPKIVSPFTSFKIGISKLHSFSHSYLSMEKDGSQYLSSCLYYFTKAVASKLGLEDHKNPVGPIEIRNVLANFFGPAIFKSAISEGNKCLMLHENDLLKFDPRDIHKHDPKMFSSPLETHSFRPGVHFLLHHRFSRPFAAVDNSSEYVEHVLLEVARLFGSEVGGNCARSKAEFMDENDIKSVMDDILPGELRRHAIARATKALADYVAETSELYHSTMSNAAEGFPGLNTRKASPKPSKRAKVETKSKPRSSSKTIVPKGITRKRSAVAST